MRLQPREEEQQQQQEQNSDIKTGPKLQKLVENYCFSKVSEVTLGSFGARFWRCSVLHGHCVSPSGRVRLQPREAEQQQQREQCTNSGTKTGRKLLFFEAVRLDFGAAPSFRATVSLSGRMRFQPREEEQQQQREQQEGSISHCTNNGTKTGQKLVFF